MTYAQLPEISWSSLQSPGLVMSVTCNALANPYFEVLERVLNQDTEQELFVKKEIVHKAQSRSNRLGRVSETARRLRQPRCRPHVDADRQLRRKDAHISRWARDLASQHHQEEGQNLGAI